MISLLLIPISLLRTIVFAFMACCRRELAGERVDGLERNSPGSPLDVEEIKRAKQQRKLSG